MKILRMGLYLVLLLGLIFAGVYFKSYYIFIMTVCALIILIGDIILFFIPAGKIQINIKSESSEYVKKEKVNLSVKIHNKKLFPVFRAKVNISFKNKFYKEGKTEVYVSLPLFISRNIKMSFESDKAGIIDICGEIEEYSDMLGIFVKKTDIKNNYAVTVMPQRGETILTATGETDSDQLPAANVYASVSGDVSGYGEYRGERKNNINWKLFSRTEKLYVKEFERTSAEEAVVLLDMYAENIDRGLDILYDIKIPEEGYNLLWFPQGCEEFESAYINDEGALKNAVYRIFMSSPCGEKNRGLNEYKRLYGENKVLYISDKMELL